MGFLISYSQDSACADWAVEDADEKLQVDAGYYELIPFATKTVCNMKTRCKLLISCL
jgi:hypothetical protein